MSIDPKFSLGRIVATPRALELIQELKIDPLRMLVLHSLGIWGDISPQDKEANESALVDGSRILSAHKVNGHRFWIITEAEDDTGHRASTCLLLPDEY